MAIPSSLITNISLGSVGLATVGGMVYGGYELLKDNPRPISEFLNVKRKVSLSKEGDEDAGKANGKKYLDKYNPPPKPKAEGDTSSTDPAPEPIKNVGNLNNGDNIKNQKETVPPVFKERCEQEKNKQVAGIGKEEFRNYLDYCTKDDVSDV